MGSFYEVVATFNHFGGSFNLFKYHLRGCLINYFFSNLGLCATCWARFMCHHESWPTSVILLLSVALNAFPEEIFPEIHYHIFRLVLQNFALPWLLSWYLFLSLCFLLTFPWLVCCCSCISMWGKIIIPMYRFWLHGLYALHGPNCSRKAVKLTHCRNSMIATVQVK